MKSSLVCLSVPLFGASAAVAYSGGRNRQPLQRCQVTVFNLTQGQLLTPPVVVMCTRSSRLVQRGNPALARRAELVHVYDASVKQNTEDCVRTPAPFCGNHNVGSGGEGFVVSTRGSAPQPRSVRATRHLRQHRSPSNTQRSLHLSFLKACRQVRLPYSVKLFRSQHTLFCNLLA